MRASAQAEAQGRYPICAYLTASMTLPAILMGMEKWIELLLDGPAEVRDELLAKCSDFFRREAAAYREAGADVLLYSDPFGSWTSSPSESSRSSRCPGCGGISPAARTMSCTTAAGRA